MFSLHLWFNMSTILEWRIENSNLVSLIPDSSWTSVALWYRLIHPIWSHSILRYEAVPLSSSPATKQQMEIQHLVLWSSLHKVLPVGSKLLWICYNHFVWRCNHLFLSDNLLSVQWPVHFRCINCLLWSLLQSRKTSGLWKNHEAVKRHPLPSFLPRRSQESLSSSTSSTQHDSFESLSSLNQEASLILSCVALLQWCSWDLPWQGCLFK